MSMSKPDLSVFQAAPHTHCPHGTLVETTCVECEQEFNILGAPSSRLQSLFSDTDETTCKVIEQLERDEMAGVSPVDSLVGVLADLLRYNEAQKQPALATRKRAITRRKLLRPLEGG